ncbi:MAG: hypothetical protein JO086_03390 [Acidimicrobiia bacterium]|nr:hypothetical protein [Acidimicrobiia bacterium]
MTLTTTPLDKSTTPQLLEVTESTLARHCPTARAPAYCDWEQAKWSSGTDALDPHWSPTCSTKTQHRS